MENEQVDNLEVVQEVEVSPEIENIKKIVIANVEQLEQSQIYEDEVFEKPQKLLEKLEQELFIKEKNFTLKENGLEAFSEIINVNNADDLSKVVDKLTKIVNDIKISNAYVPKDMNGTQDAYSVAIQNGDVKNAISFKLSNLFKK